MRPRSALEVLESRWASQVLLALPEESRRFNFLLANIVGVSDRVLTVRLRELQRDGLVIRDVEAGPPVAVFYSLTKRGAALVPALRELAAL